ncbi:MAG: hypothetical protein ABI237_03340 [Ginsengibacter sp.]
MKNKFILLAFLSSAIFSCNSNQDQKKEVPKDIISPDTVTTIKPSADSLQATIITSPGIWTVEEGTQGKIQLKKPEMAGLDTLSSTHLIQLINDNFPEIRLDFVKVSHDTVYVKIPDSKRLTQGLGDSGAENYLASVTFTLTERKNIQYVNIRFQRGDHAEPGVYTREDFKSLR